MGIGDDSALVLIWHQGHGGAMVDAEPSSGAHTSTWGEFQMSNPDIEPYELSKIWNTIRNGETYTENLGAGGSFCIQLAQGGKTMSKMNNSLGENASCAAVGVGSVGASPAIATKTRVREEDGDEDGDEDEDLVEFVRNGVPYAGRVVSEHGNFVVVDVGGRRIVVETGVLDDSPQQRSARAYRTWKTAEMEGSPQAAFYKAEYEKLNNAAPVAEHVVGPNAKREMNAMRSPTTPNRTMQKFVGAESMGGAFEGLGDQEDDGQIGINTTESWKRR